MNFDLTEEQQLVVDSVSRFVKDNYNLEQRQEHLAQPGGFDAGNWQTMAELGWLAMPFSEADGGFGGDQVDTMLIMEQFGQGMVLEPFVPSIVLGGGAIKRAGSDEMRAEVLPGVLDGSKQLALAYAEEQSHFDLHDVVTTARADGDGFVLNGQKSMVTNGGTASHFVVSARTSGGQIDTSGITLFLVDASTDGVKVDSFPTVDGLQAAEVTFKDVRVPAGNVIGEVNGGHEVLYAVVLDGILAYCAEAVGAMEMLYKDTIEYTQEREQFDHPLSDFQVLQHRMVDMFMEYEQSKSMLIRATMEVAASGVDAARTVHACKHLIGKNAIFIGENAVQLHGGMGMTEELRIGHFFKRLLVIDAQFGNADYHLHKFAA